MFGEYSQLVPVIAARAFFVVVLIRLVTKKSTPESERVSGWARRNELELVIAEKRYLFKGPFMLRKGVGPVYRIVATDRDGKGVFGMLHLRSSLFGKDSEEMAWSREEPGA